MSTVSTTAVTNLVVLEGVLRAEPVEVELPSGDTLLTFDVRVSGPDGRMQSVPVSWIGAQAKRPRVSRDEPVLVVGQVHRRFFRSVNGSASRVDVRAASITMGSSARRRKVLERVLTPVLTPLGG